MSEGHRSILRDLTRTVLRDLHGTDRMPDPEPVQPSEQEKQADREAQAARERHAAWQERRLGPIDGGRSRASLEAELDRVSSRVEQKLEDLDKAAPEYRRRAEASLARAEEQERQLRAQLGYSVAVSSSDLDDEDEIGDDVRCERCERIVFADAADKWRGGGRCSACAPPSWASHDDPRRPG
jgi:hypothetical protein